MNSSQLWTTDIHDKYKHHQKTFQWFHSLTQYFCSFLTHQQIPGIPETMRRSAPLLPFAVSNKINRQGATLHSWMQNNGRHPWMKQIVKQHEDEWQVNVLSLSCERDVTSRVPVIVAPRSSYKLIHFNNSSCSHLQQHVPHSQSSGKFLLQMEGRAASWFWDA